MIYQFLKYGLVLMFFLNVKSVFSQATNYSGSLIFGPEVGLGTPKTTYRNQSEGFYFGAFMSINFIEVLSLSVGPIGGYRWKGVGAESSLSLTCTFDTDNTGKFSKTISRFWLTFNPRAVISYKSVFASFGPGLYLIKSKKGETLWNDMAKEKLGHPVRFNYEIGRYGAF